MKNLKTMSKRGLALLIALMMCLSVMNLTVFAAENDEDGTVIVQDIEENTEQNEVTDPEATEPGAPGEENSNIDGEPIVDGEHADIDDEPVVDDENANVDGEPAVDDENDGENVDVDGEPVVDAENDGENADVDGEPVVDAENDDENDGDGIAPTSEEDSDPVEPETPTEPTLYNEVGEILTWPEAHDSRLKFDVPEGETYTIDLHGGMISDPIAVNINGSGTLIITGEGTISCTNSGFAAITVFGGTLELEGGTITSNTTGDGAGIFVARDNATVNMYSGMISGCTDAANGGGVCVSKGTFNMYGGTISDCFATNGGGVYVRDGASFTLDGGTIDRCQAEAYGGGVYAENGFAMTNGTISNCGAVNGGGVYVAGGMFEMSGGVIGGENAGNRSTKNASSPASFEVYGGGGVYLAQGASMTMSGSAEISHNEARESGGGILIKYGADLTMNGGVISSNTAVDSEGGGIYCHGTGTINAGRIENNTTNTTYDFGGGGIFVNSDGVMHIYNALITDNTAEAYGGGVAGCTNGVIYVLSVNGAAIYGNSATGRDGLPDNPKELAYLAQNNTTTISARYENDCAELGSAGGWNDFYSARSAVVFDRMLGGYSANWQGTWSTKTGGDIVVTSDGKQVNMGYLVAEVETGAIPAGGFVQATGLMGLTANPSDEAMAYAQNAAVVISDNHSGTNGGGITCNGTLFLGDRGQAGTQFTIDAAKTLEGGTLAGEDFTFQLLDGEKEIATATNDVDGKITFKLTADVFKNAIFTGGQATVELTLKEVDNGAEGIVYDGAEYTVTLTVEKTSQSTTELKPGSGSASTVNYDSYKVIKTVIVKDGETADPTFTNYQLASLTINKVVSGGGAAAEEKEFTFTVTGPDGFEETFPLKGGDSKTLYVQPGEYTVTESEEGVAVSGYTWSVSGSGAKVTLAYGESKEVVVTNTYTPETPPETPNNPGPSTIQLTVNKRWVGDEEANRPASVEVQLYRNGAASGEPVTLNESNGWSHTWTGLSDSATWTVEEINVPDGYISTSVKTGSVVTITNTYEVPELPEDPDPQEPEDPQDPEPEDPQEPQNPVPEVADEEIEDFETPLAPAPEEELEEPEVPLGPAPEEVVEDPEVPLANVPKTGDNVVLWLFAAALSGLSMLWLALSGKKGEDEEA